MPQVVGAVKLIAAWWATFAKAHALAAFVIKTAAMVAVSYGTSRLMARRAGSGALTAGSPIQMSRDPAAPRKLVYGEHRVSGPIIFGHVTGASNEYIHLVIPLANHFCWELGEIYFNDEPLGLPWGGGEVPLPGSKYHGFVRVKKHRGEQTTADSDLVAECPGVWSNAHVGHGVAYIYVRLKWDQNVFPGGIPNISCVVKGKQVFDPRDDTYKYTTNAALCLNDFMLMTEDEGGLGAEADEVNAASVIEAANVCDIEVDRAEDDPEVQYAINGVIELNIDPQPVIDELCAAMAGKVFYISGEFFVRGGAWREPTVSLNGSCLRGGVSVANPTATAEKFNGVRGTFADPTKLWQRNEYPAQQSNTFVTADGGEIWRTADSAMVTSPTQNQRIARQGLLRARQGLTTSWACNLRAMEAMAGDTVLLSLDRLGWDEKAFEILEFNFSAQKGDRGGIGYGVEFVAQETHPSIFDWNTSLEQTVDPAPNTTLPDPWTALPPSAPVLTSGTALLIKGSDGTVLSRIRATWTPPADTFVQSGGRFEVEYKKSADTDWQSAGPVPGGSQFHTFGPVDDGVEYDVRVRSINTLGVASTWATTSNYTVVGKSEAPNPPTNLSASGLAGAILLEWDNPDDPDLMAVEIWTAATNVFPGGAGQRIGAAPGTRGIHRIENLSGGTTLYAWIGTVDSSDNPSATQIGPESATATSGTAGTDAHTIWGDMEAPQVNCDASGNPVAGELGVGGRVRANIYALRGTTTLTATTGTPGANQYRVTKINDVNCTSSILTGNVIRLDAVTADSGKVEYKVEVAGGVEFLREWRWVKTKAGAPGENSATAFLYQRSTTTPALPSSSLTYTFGSGVLTGTLGSWSQTVPTANGNPLWVTTAYASSVASTDTILPGEWKPAAKLAEDGAPGSSGTSTTLVLLYKRAATLPAGPSTTSTFTFSSGALTGASNGWTQAVPANDGNPLWVIGATASSTTATDTIASGEWSTAVELVKNGLDGNNGLNSATVFLYKRSATTPAVPSTTSTYTFSTGALTGANNGWTQSVPVSGTDPVYVITASAVATTATDTITSGEWSSPAILAQNGSNGSPGLNGTNGAGYGGTSTTGLTIGTGSRTLATQTGLAYQVGDVVRVRYSVAPDQYMEGIVTAYNAGTGSLTFTSTFYVGTGTYSAWILSVGGANGRGPQYAGEWVSGGTYYLDSVFTTIVSYGGVYYRANNPAKSGLNTWLTPGVSTDWVSAGATLAFAATDLFLARDATIMRTLVMGDGTVANAGIIRSAGATAFGTGTGFWQGYDGTTAKWRVGNPSGNKISWDGAALDVVGSFSAGIGDARLNATASGMTVGNTSIRYLEAATFAAGTTVLRAKQGSTVCAEFACYDIGAGQASGSVTVATSTGVTGSLAPNAVRFGSGLGFYGSSGDVKTDEDLIAASFTTAGSVNAKGLYLSASGAELGCRNIGGTYNELRWQVGVAVDIQGVNLRVFNSAGAQKFRVDNTTGYIYVNGNQVVGARGTRGAADIAAVVALLDSWGAWA